MINDSGAVISGTLANDTFLRPQGWQRIINDYYFISAYTNGGNFSLVTIVIGITVIYIALLYQVMGTFVTKAELRFLSVQKGQ